MTLPRGESVFQAGDEIVAVASPEGAKKLSVLLAHPVYPVRESKQKSPS
jgi:Trk K+ transport system NAD-binding subunit